MSDRTPCRGLIADVVARTAQLHTANMHVHDIVSHFARRPRARAASLAYSPKWRPDLTLMHAARDGNPMIADATGPSVVTQTAVPASSYMPLAAAAAHAIAAAAEKHRKYGNALPRTMPPFVVEHAGGIGKAGLECSRRCRKKALSKLHVKEQGVLGLFLAVLP